MVVSDITFFLQNLKKPHANIYHKKFHTKVKWDSSMQKQTMAYIPDNLILSIKREDN